MNYQTQTLVWARRIIQAYLDALSVRPAAALVATPFLHLTHDPAYDPTPDSDIAVLALQEGLFTGYTSAGIAIVPAGTVQLGGVQLAVIADVLLIVGSAVPQVSDVITGYWIEDGSDFVAGERFAGGISFAAAVPGDFLNLKILLPLPFIVTAAA